MAALVITLGVLALAATWLALCPPTLLYVGRRILSAVLQGDAEVIERHVFERERKELALDANKIRRVIDEVVRPNLGTIEQAGEAYHQSTSETGDQLYIAVPIKSSDGTWREFGLTVRATEEGPRFSLCRLIIQSWRAKYKDDPRVRSKAADFHVLGIDADLPKLREIGITHYVPDDVQRPIVDWEAYRAMWVPKGKSAPQGPSLAP